MDIPDVTEVLVDDDRTGPLEHGAEVQTSQVFTPITETRTLPVPNNLVSDSVCSWSGCHWMLSEWGSNRV